MGDGNGSDYIPLMSEEAGEDDTTIYEERKEVRAVPQRGAFSCSFLQVSVALACFISLLSLAITSLSSVAYLTSSRGIEHNAVHNLRHPSLYIGLDSVSQIKEVLRVQSAIAKARPKPSPTAISHPTHTPSLASGSLLPFKSFRINSDYPDQSKPTDGWVLLTEKDMTLMEFRLPASGFTSCNFMGIFPGRRELYDKLLTLEGDTSKIEIWDVTVPESFDAAAVTWNNKPPRVRHLGTISAAFGTNSTTEPFRCVQGISFMVELSCMGIGCRVELKEEDKLPRLGFQIISQ